MEEIEKKGRGLGAFLRTVCFLIIGICAFSNPLDPINLFNIGFGAITGLIFGFLYRRFLCGFLNMFNSKLKKEHGKKVVRDAVDRGMLFIIPFVVMLAAATYLLNWSMTAAFVSAGIMAVGTASSIETGKIKGKQEIKNTIAASGISGLFSFLWIMSYPFLAKAPLLLEGGITLIKQMMAGGGGVL